MLLRKTTISLIAASAVLSGAALAQDYYISLSGGLNFQNSSDNAGVFVGPFTTGTGTTIPGGTVLPDGTDVGWNTEFENGYVINGAIGRKYDAFRGELEVSYQSAGVETHTGVSTAGIALDNEDAGVLITGSPNLGVSVGDLVAAGEGSLDTVYVMANFLVDIKTGTRFTPYIGAGAGVGFVDVNYSPSATPIIDDNATAFAYQGKAGIAFQAAPGTEIFAGYRYRATTDVNVDASLFAANFDIENKSSIVEAGVRFTF
ncbi:MAG: hypothetical protein DHS20C05_22030 [Hyphococcus sp.]|nr:MAG: hypothetical protein DHS20C05_22030 [Marinicaulis sp.]